jgi:hypothetical protein
MFVGGRYLKLARHIAQTPWVVNGARLAESSVQECASGPIMRETRADECVLVGAGREDADVRMLGTGRPFFLEVRNPRRTEVDAVVLAEEVNRAHRGRVQLSRVRWISKCVVICGRSSLSPSTPSPVLTLFISCFTFSSSSSSPSFSSVLSLCLFFFFAPRLGSNLARARRKVGDQTH